MRTKEELIAAGVPAEAINDRSDHPRLAVSTWDVAASDKQAAGVKMNYHLPHIKPESILIAPIGNLWDEGGWWRLQDMLLHTSELGYSVSLQEMMDSSLFSFEAIAMMRWQASLMARDGGLEWILMVDNDVQLEKDTLVRLLAHDRPIVFPFLEDLSRRWPRVVAPLSGPNIEESGQGLLPVRWAAMSCMLINTKIFNVLEPTCWRGDDYIFAQALNHIGHRIYLDTDTVVNVTHGPTRHASKDYKEFWADHEAMRDRLRFEYRDRRAPPGFNPETDNGMMADKTYIAVPANVARPQANGTGD